MRRTNLVDVRLETNKGDRAQAIGLGDIHLGYPTTDLALVQSVIDRCIEKHIYVIGQGDYLECGTTSSVGDSVYQQTLNPHQQMEMMIEILKPLADAGLLLGLIAGNHENRITKTTSIDVTQVMARILGVRYLGFSSFLLLRVGKQSYTGFACHGASGARLDYTKIKAALDLFRFNDVELITMGHVHTLNHMTQLYQKVDKTRKMVIEATRHVVLTGSFLRYRGSYAEMMLLHPAPTGVAYISLYGDSHNIHVSL